MRLFLRIAGIAAIVLIAMAFALRELLDYRNKADFDREVWLKAPHCAGDGCDAECVRGEMVRDLSRNYLRPGIDMADVDTLLGAGNTRMISEMKCLDYNIGMCSGLRADYDALIICFDNAGKLVKAWTRQD